MHAIFIEINVHFHPIPCRHISSFPCGSINVFHALVYYCVSPLLSVHMSDLSLYWVEAMINQTRQQTNYCLGLALQGSRRGNGTYNNSNNEEDDAVERMRKDIEANQDNALSLCTEKVLLARQAYDLVSFLHAKAFNQLKLLNIYGVRLCWEKLDIFLVLLGYAVVPVRKVFIY